MRRAQLKAAPKLDPHHHTLEAARTLAYHAHVLAAAAIAWKRGVEQLQPEDAAHPIDGSRTLEDLREDSQYLAAQASLDALEREARNVLTSLVGFREYDDAPATARPRREV